MVGKRNIKDELGYTVKPYSGRNPVDVFVLKDISRFLKKDKIIRWDIVIRGENVRSLEGVEEIRGNFGISNSNIEELGDLRVVKGDFWISATNTPCKIQTLGNLEKVGGDLTLRYSQIADLGSLQHVGGQLSLRDTPIKNLGGLRSVGGNLYLPKSLEGTIDLSAVKVGGAVKFWNDDKHAGNPQTRSSAELAHIWRSRDAGNYEAAWTALCEVPFYITPGQIFEFTEKLNRSVMDGRVISAIAGTSFLTAFGRNNIDKIQDVAHELLVAFEAEKGRSFIHVFFNRMERAEGSHWIVLFGYEAEYYKSFYVSEAEYEFWTEVDKRQAQQGLRSQATHVANNAVNNQLRRFLTTAEDIYRERIGMPRVGEGWISETELYYKIKTHFPEIEVVQHGRPRWLGQQSLDVYLPALNFGIEYQGVQHFRPVSMFGGEAALEKNIERDRRKLERAAANGCPIIYVYEGYAFEEVKTVLEKRINGGNSNLEFPHINRPREAQHLLNFTDLET